MRNIVDAGIWICVAAAIAAILWMCRQPAEWDSPEYRLQLERHKTGPSVHDFIRNQGFDPSDFLDD